MAKEERIGNPNRNLVLRTSGSIKVLVGDKYYSLKYSNSEEEEDTETKTENEFIISQDPIDFYLTGQLAYPGDNKVIFVIGDSIYYTANNSYYSFDDTLKQQITDLETSNSTTSKNVFNSTVTFNGNPPFKVAANSDTIKNLSAEKLGGYRESDFFKKTDNMSFNTISTSDGKFNVENGNISASSLTVDSIYSENLYGNLYVGNTLQISFDSIFLNGNITNTNINILSDLYNVYKEGTSFSGTFFSLCSNLLTITNSSYNWEPIEEEYIDQLCELGFICEIKNEEQWKSITDNYGESLYDRLIDNRIMTTPRKYNESLLIYNVTSGVPELGSEFSFNIPIEIYVDESGQEISDICNLPDTWTIKETEVTVHAEITSINDSYIGLSTNLKPKIANYITSSTTQASIITLNENNEEVILYSFDVTSNVRNEGTNEDCISEYSFDYLSEISNNYILLGESESTLGTSDSGKWITINSKNGILKTGNYELGSDGTFKTNSFNSQDNQLNIVGNLNTSSFNDSNKILTVSGTLKTPAIIINDNGTVTIGQKTGVLTVDDSGTLKLQ